MSHDIEDSGPAFVAGPFVISGAGGLVSVDARPSGSAHRLRNQPHNFWTLDSSVGTGTKTM